MMKAGLWENTFKIKSDDAKMNQAMKSMKQQMDSMPAAQRQMIEAMMKKQGASIGDSSTSQKICVTKEQAQKMQIPKGPNN
jgi:major membrane immunogen (membrane-anchored lipoprotein)